MQKIRQSRGEEISSQLMSGKMFTIFGKLIATLVSIAAMIDTLSQYQLIILSLPISMIMILVYWIKVKFKAIVL